MLSFSGNDSGSPLWTQSHAWRWILGKGRPPSATSSSSYSQEDFLTSHIRLAKAYMASTPGQAALRSAGYLPTASSRSPEDRGRVQAVELLDQVLSHGGMELLDARDVKNLAVENICQSKSMQWGQMNNVLDKAALEHLLGLKLLAEDQDVICARKAH